MTRAEWLESRRSYIGASDIGALLLDQDGHPLHPYKTPHDVWLDKTGRAVGQESERTLMGQLLEPLIVRRFQLANPGVQAVKCGTLRGEREWYACNPDRIVRGRVSVQPGTSVVVRDPKGVGAVLQLKSAGYFGAKDLGPDGTDELHDWYVAQVQWELMMAKADLAIVGLLYDTHLYRQYLVWRDDALIGMLRRVADHFWTTYVQRDAEPPVSGHRRDREWLQEAWTPKPDARVAATPEIDDDCEKLARELANLERLTNVVEGRKSRIKAFMGEAAVLDTSFGQVTWKADKNGKRTLRLDGIKAARPTTTKEDAA